MNKIEIIKQLQKMPENARVIWMLEQVALDEMGLTDEVSQLIKECKNEIITLRTSIENLQQENMEIFKNNCIMAKQIHIRTELEKIESEKARKKIKKLLLQYDKNVENLSLEQIDNIINEVNK